MKNATGGVTTKIHLAINANEHPIDFKITADEVTERRVAAPWLNEADKDRFRAYS